jgi:phosphoribosylglycinamide formyltransferase-1
MPVPGGLDDAPIPAIAFLVSGEGTILEALAERARSGRLGAQIVLVIADRESTGALGRAERAGLPTAVVPRRSATPEAWGESLDGQLRRAGATLVVLDGFLSILPRSFVDLWPHRILNVHPSLLPKYGGHGMFGDAVHRAVLASGDTETGVTVHEVTDAIDAGPIRVQRRLVIEPTDTVSSLRTKLRPIEIGALEEAIRAAVS